MIMRMIVTAATARSLTRRDEGIVGLGLVSVRIWGLVLMRLGETDGLSGDGLMGLLTRGCFAPREERGKSCC